MELKPFQAIFFDLGNVLVHVRHEDALDRFHSLFPQVNDIDIHKIFTDASPLKIQYESGKIGSFSFYQEVIRQLKIELDYQLFISLWQEIFHPNESMLRFLPVFRKKYRLILLSNTNPLHVQYLEEHYDFMDHFHDFVFSYDTGWVKPESGIYRAAVVKAGCRPEQCVFVDDKDENVNGALQEKIQAFQFILPDRIAALDNKEKSFPVTVLLGGG